MPDEFDRHQPLLRSLVRLLGIFFVINGLTGLIGSGIDLVHQIRQAFEFSLPLASHHAVGWTIASAVEMTAGFFLLLKSHVAIDAIFHENIGPRKPGDES